MRISTQESHIQTFSLQQMRRKEWGEGRGRDIRKSHPLLTGHIHLVVTFSSHTASCVWLTDDSLRYTTNRQGPRYTERQSLLYSVSPGAFFRVGSIAPSSEGHPLPGGPGSCNLSPTPPFPPTCGSLPERVGRLAPSCGRISKETLLAGGDAFQER